MCGGPGRGIEHSNEAMKRTPLILSVGLLTLIAAGLLATRSGPHFQELSQAEFIAMVQSNLLAKVVVYFPPKPGQIDGVPVMIHEVRGTFYQIDAAGQILKAQGTPKESRFIARVHLTSELEQKLTTRTNFSFDSPNPLVQRVSQWLGRSK